MDCPRFCGKHRLGDPHYQGLRRAKTTDCFHASHVQGPNRCRVNLADDRANHSNQHRPEAAIVRLDCW